MKFDINIAVLGCQSTGKSTAVNAICEAEVTEVDFRRATESVNVYRLFVPNAEEPTDMIIDVDGASTETKEQTISSDEGPAYKKRLRLTKETFLKVKKHNEQLRAALSSERPTFYDVPVTKLPITMRENTQLCIYESPGLNVSNNDHKGSRVFFEKNWDSLDACILVVDAKLSADHEEQKETMEFVRNLCKNVKEIPIFIVCNKVDDPDSLPGTEDEVKLQQTRKAVEKIWNVPCRERALKELLESQECGKFEDVFPVFVPTSAKTAFFLRAGLAMAEEDFLEKMKPETYHDIGLREFGKLWRAKSHDEKAKAMYCHVQKPSSQEELLRISGFANLLKALEKGVGGDRAQLGLIKTKLKLELTNSEFRAGEVSALLRRINDKLSLLDFPKDALMKKFWDSYLSAERGAFEAFDSHCKPEALALAAQMLIEYQEFCVSPESGDEWNGEVSKIQTELAGFVQKMIATINEHSNNWSFVKWNEAYWESRDSGASSGFGKGQKKRKASSHGSATAANLSWESLSPVDWQRILTSILLLCCKEVFCCHFGREIELLERHKLMFHKHCMWCPTCESCGCSDAGHTTILDDTRVDLKHPDMMPLDEDSHALLVKIKIPRDFKGSPTHFAHIGWLFCKAME